MNEKRDILDDSTLKGNPFRMPEGYFDGFEDRVMARIAAESQPAPSRRDRVWTVLKPALLLAAMFALVFGMGYGVLSFTHTLNSGASAAGVSDYASVEEEMITPASLLNYYQSDS